MSETILPSNERPLQQALAKLDAETIAGLNTGLVRQAKRPQDCPANMLPWLAWENSISDAEGWQFAENETQMRALVAGYIEKHERKGTPSVIRQLFRDMQLGEIDIIERVTSLKWNGQATFGGDYFFGGSDGDWACYAIKVYRPITNQQAAILRGILAQITPARCRLMYLSFRDTPIFWNGEINFDGSYNFGAA
jgi:phage tail P2-like protein